MIDVSLRATGAECEVLDERVNCGRRGQLGLRLKSLACLLHLSVACSGQGPVAVPSVEIDPVQVVSGSPVQVTLTFSVLPTAGFDEDHLVFLHFLNGIFFVRSGITATSKNKSGASYVFPTSATSGTPKKGRKHHNEPQRAEKKSGKGLRRPCGADF